MSKAWSRYTRPSPDAASPTRGVASAGTVRASAALAALQIGEEPSTSASSSSSASTSP